MAIRKRQWTAPDGTPKQAWQVDYRDTAGKRRSKQFSRKRDAEAWQVGAAHEVATGIHTADRASITVGQAVELWTASAQARGLERATRDGYDTVARLHIVPLIGSERLSRLTQPRVEAYRDQLMQTRSRIQAARAVRALSRIIAEAQRRGLVAQNVAREVKVSAPGRDKAKVEIPSKVELRAMIDAASEDFRPFVLTAIFTGLRASELRGLRWTDIDLKKATVTVRQRADKFGVIGPPKSKAGYRTVPMPARLVSELREWKLRCPNGPLGLVFPNSQGGVAQYGHLLRRRFHPLQLKAGVADRVGEDDEGKPILKARYGIHALRHAAASAWIAQRVDLKRLQTWLGHESIELSLGTYGHLIVDESADAAIMSAAQDELLG